MPFLQELNGYRPTFKHRYNRSELYTLRYAGVKN